MTVSIDAPDQQIYESIREGGSWKDVVDNLRAAVKYPNRHQGRKVGINMTVFQANVESVFRWAPSPPALVSIICPSLDRDGSREVAGRGMEIDHGDPGLVNQLQRIRRHSRGCSSTITPRRWRSSRCPPYRSQAKGSAICRGSRSKCIRRVAHPAAVSHGIDLGPAGDAWLGAPMAELRRQFLEGEVDPVRLSGLRGVSEPGRACRATARTVIPCAPRKSRPRSHAGGRSE